MSKWSDPAYMQAYSRQWYLTNRERHLRCQIKRKYGLTLEDYRMLLARGCFICRRRAVHVDHDHATGSVRGALCRRCNLGLGMFGDGLILLKKAVTYLESSIH